MYEVEVLHPLLVHFPVALLVLAAPVTLWWLLRPEPGPRWSMLLLLFAGAIGATAAYLSGEAMHEYSNGVQSVQDLVEGHEKAALATCIMAWAAACLAGISIGRTREVGSPSWLFRAMVAVLAVAAAALVAYTGHRGGLMTWG